MIKKIKHHYKKAFSKFGATSRGVDWKDNFSSNLRHKIFLDNLIKNIESKPITLLDVGCGYGAFYEYIKESHIRSIDYKGIDLVNEMINYAIENNSDEKFRVADFLSLDSNTKYDFLVLNGMLTQKFEFDDKIMNNFFDEILKKINQICLKGYCFNVLSENVDFKNPQNFYLSANQIKKKINSFSNKKIISIEEKKLFETFYFVIK